MKTFFKYFRPTFIPVALFALIGLFLWQYNMSEINKDMQDKVSTIIKKTVNQQLKTNPFLPDVVLINADSIQNKQLTDSLRIEITSFLTDYYLKKDNKTKYNSLNFEPFFIFPQKANKEGNYILTAEQLNNLKYHIEFLAKKVESEVNRTKEEVGRDIDRLNTWVTIWIGFIGLIGIFIPIILNIDVSKNVTEAVKRAKVAEEKSVKANESANDAITLLKSKQESLNKIENIEADINRVETLSNEANEKAENAKNDSLIALNETKEVKSNLSLIIALNSLKEFDANVIIKLSKNNRLPFLINILNKALKALNDNIDYYNNPIILNWLGQFAMSIQGISYFKFINRRFTKKLNDIANIVDEFINDGTKENYQNIINSLERLLTDNTNQTAST